MVALIFYLALRFVLWSSLTIRSFFKPEHKTIHKHTTDEDIIELIKSSKTQQFMIGISIADLILTMILLFSGFYIIPLTFFFIGYIFPYIFRSLDYERSLKLKNPYKVICITFDFYMLYYFINIYLNA